MLPGKINLENKIILFPDKKYEEIKTKNVSKQHVKRARKN